MMQIRPVGLVLVLIVVALAFWPRLAELLDSRAGGQPITPIEAMFLIALGFLLLRVLTPSQNAPPGTAAGEDGAVGAPPASGIGPGTHRATNANSVPPGGPAGYTRRP